MWLSDQLLPEQFMKMLERVKNSVCVGVFVVTLISSSSMTFSQGDKTTAPRIVNIYNFIRNSDYRVKNSEDVLLEATREEIKLVKDHHLHGTWALQYDALINPKYQNLLKQELEPEDEIAAWWEIPKPLAEKAGLKWRGDHDWDSRANVGFSPGYTPDERRKLVDVYMAEFKSVFGYYPKTAGSWFIDEVTLACMADRYGVIASCNCKDQVGTDGYTLWGGYWNQAYYPSRLNAYMPAQNKSAQLDVPIFRMLGSDPIYQYADARGIFSMEPVYAAAGGSSQWVDWFTDSLRHQPCLAFAYAQVGQENSFGWRDIKKGLTMQMDKLAQQASAGEIRIETLAASGQWFRTKFSVTPATAVVALEDWKHENRKSVWYDSRFYRVNLLWEQDGLFIRDLHRFDEKIASVTHDKELKATSLAYGTLPIMEGALWSSKQKKAGIFPVTVSADVATLPLQLSGSPVVKGSNSTDLSIAQPLGDGGTINIICSENKITITAVDHQAHPLKWAFDCTGGPKFQSAVQTVKPTGVSYISDGMTYDLTIASDSGSCQQLPDGSVRLSPNGNGMLVLMMDQ